MQEQQLTKGPYGHMVNSNQVFSPDDAWIVYDTRNDQTHISRTCCIEKVNVHTGEVVKLYKAPNQTLHGPGVGAAAWNPHGNQIIFIHGLMNCSEANPYSFTRRFGALLDACSHSQVVSAEARTVDELLVSGALRGGTHAHSWSGDGKWISFTYNDALMEKLEQTSKGKIRDLRTIGVMSPDRGVKVHKEDHENFSGKYFSSVVATVTENPRPGSDEIEKAFDECWVGKDGYVRKDGSRQKRAIAFQGHVRQTDGSLLTEIFITDIPQNISESSAVEALEGTTVSRPRVPDGVVQRRITFSGDRKFPGIQGLRFWLRSSPDGSRLYFLMKDDDGIVQVFGVSVHGGAPRKVTSLPASVQAQFNLSPDGRSLALVADNSVWVVDIKSGRSTRVTERKADEDAPVLAVNWNHAGNILVYNRYAPDGSERYLQIFKVAVN